MAAETESLHAITDEINPVGPDARALLERGRYAVTGMPDGSWAIVRAGPICETCQACGCGEQQEPIMVPAFVVAVITGERQLPGPLQKMMGMFGG